MDVGAPDGDLVQLGPEGRQVQGGGTDRCSRCGGGVFLGIGCAKAASRQRRRRLGDPSSSPSGRRGRRNRRRRRRRSLRRTSPAVVVGCARSNSSTSAAPADAQQRALGRRQRRRLLRRPLGRRRRHGRLRRRRGRPVRERHQLLQDLLPGDAEVAIVTASLGTETVGARRIILALLAVLAFAEQEVFEEISTARNERRPWILSDPLDVQVRLVNVDLRKSSGLLQTSAKSNGRTSSSRVENSASTELGDLFPLPQME